MSVPEGGSPWLAGADVGGSRIRIVVARDDREITRCETPRAAPNLSPRTATLLASEIAIVLHQAAREAGADRIDHLVVGAAGVGREAERDALQRELLGWETARHVQVTTDLEIALVAGFGLRDPGMLLVTGTGSSAVARVGGETEGSSPRLERVGGLGWRVGDEGGGYAIGCAALQAVVLWVDGRGPDTRLRDGIAERLGVRDRDLVRWAGSARVQEVAALAPVVLALADQDAVAGSITARAAEDLASLVRALAERVGTGLPLALAGGLLHADSPLRRGLTEELARTLPALRIVRTVDPLVGALRMADTTT